MNVEEIFHEERQRQKRLDDTYLAVMALPRTERLQLVVRVIDAVVTDGRGPIKQRKRRRQAGAGATTGRASASIKDAVAEVLAVSGPLTARVITDRIQARRPGTGLASVHGELARMRGDQVVVQAGVGANNGGLYALAPNGALTTGTT